MEYFSSKISNIVLNFFEIVFFIDRLTKKKKMTQIPNSTNYGSSLYSGEPIPIYDDATWILTSTFIIFTMQSGLVLTRDVHDLFHI